MSYDVSFRASWRRALALFAVLICVLLFLTGCDSSALRDEEQSYYVQFCTFEGDMIEEYLDVRRGDKVVYSKFGYVKIVLDGVTYCVSPGQVQVTVRKNNGETS